MQLEHVDGFLEFWRGVRERSVLESASRSQGHNLISLKHKYGKVCIDLGGRDSWLKGEHFEFKELFVNGRKSHGKN